LPASSAPKKCAKSPAPTGIASLFDHLCEVNAVSHNPVRGVKRPKAEGNEGKTGFSAESTESWPLLPFVALPTTAKVQAEGGPKDVDLHEKANSNVRRSKE
jgi:hypothetical protein